MASYHPAQWVDQANINTNAKEGYYDPQPTDKPSPVNHLQSISSSLAPAPVPSAPATTSTYIPGLPQDSTDNKQKKIQRKRKKKTKTQNLVEHRGSTSSESEIQKRECKVIEATNEVMNPFYMFDEGSRVESVKETHLTDDLADSLVNPPTDQAVPYENVLEGNKEIDTDNHQGILSQENKKEIESSIFTDVALDSLNDIKNENEKKIEDI